MKVTPTSSPFFVKNLPARDSPSGRDARTDLSSDVSCIAFLLVLMLGLGANLPLQLLWVQVPVVAKNLPELALALPKMSPSSQLVVLFVLTAAAVGLWFSARFHFDRPTSSKSEKCLLYSSLLLSLAALVCFGVLWSNPIRLTENHALIFRLCVLACCFSTAAFHVVFLPFCARLKPLYVSALLAGDVLSGVVANTMASVQGIGAGLTCPEINVTSFGRMYHGQRNYFPRRGFVATTVAPVVPVPLAFPQRVFYLVGAEFVFLAFVAFLLLNCMPSLRIEYRATQGDCLSIEVAGPEDVSSSSACRPPKSKTALAMERKSAEKAATQLPLLMILAFWTSAMLSGPLSPTHAYACGPTFGPAFLSGTFMSHALAVASCFVVVRIGSRAKLEMVIALTSLASILLSYFVALVWFSHSAHSPSNSPVFGVMGEFLGSISWSTIVGLLTFGRVSAALICRLGPASQLQWFCVMSLLGAVVANLCLVGKVNVCKVFPNFQQPCSPYS